MTNLKKNIIILLTAVLLWVCSGCDRSPKEPVVHDTVADTVLLADGSDTTGPAVSADEDDSIVSPEKGGSKVKITPAPSLDRRARFKVMKASPDQIVGQWFRGDLFEEFFSDGTGLTWDSSEDMCRDEAQQFEWELKEGELTITHNLTYGGFVRNVTYIAKVDSTQMLRYDKFGNSSVFKKNL